MESIYYNPNPEEFHIGFEYEIFERNRNGWVRMIYNEYSSLSDVITFGGHNKFSVIEAIKNSNVRVKQLDHDDIISLGWEKISDKTIYRLPNTITQEVKLTLDEILTTITLRFLSKQGQEYLFCGIIKNKSELKKIMLMTQILKLP